MTVVRHQCKRDGDHTLFWQSAVGNVLKPLGESSHHAWHHEVFVWRHCLTSAKVKETVNNNIRKDVCKASGNRRTTQKQFTFIFFLDHPLVSTMLRTQHTNRKQPKASECLALKSRLPFSPLNNGCRNNCHYCTDLLFNWNWIKRKRTIIFRVWKPINA